MKKATPQTRPDDCNIMQQYLYVHICRTFEKKNRVRFELRSTPADACIFIFNTFIVKIIDK